MASIVHSAYFQWNEPNRESCQHFLNLVSKTRAVGRKWQPIRPRKRHPLTHPVLILFTQIMQYARSPLSEPSALKRAVNYLLSFPKDICRKLKAVGWYGWLEISGHISAKNWTCVPRHSLELTTEVGVAYIWRCGSPWKPIRPRPYRPLWVLRPWEQQLSLRSYTQTSPILKEPSPHTGTHTQVICGQKLCRLVWDQGMRMFERDLPAWNQNQIVTHLRHCTT